MASRRWIPVLASVLVLVAIGGGVLMLLRVAPELVLGRLSRYKTPVVIAIDVSYPGANAEMVAQAIAMPLEQQVNGVENMVSMSSQCSSDGGYMLHVIFRDGIDPNVAQMLVQNRTSLSLPGLPSIVQRTGMTVRKVVPQPVGLLCVTSPDNRYDGLYLSNFAAAQVQPELARIAGVSEVVPFGASDGQVRLLLDPGLLAKWDLTVTDFLTAIQPTSMLPGPVASSPTGAGVPITGSPPVRFTSIDQLADFVLKATPEGKILRVRDVSLPEVGAAGRSHASLNGQTAVVLAIYPLPDARASDLSRAITGKLAELRPHFPEGLSSEVAFDFAPLLDPRSRVAGGEHLVIDAELPAGAPPDRSPETLERAAEVVKKASGVKDVLALTEHPFTLIRSRPCLIVGLSEKPERKLDRNALAANLRSELRREIPDAEFRFSIPSTEGLSPVYGFPIEFMIEDRGDHPTGELMKSARALIAQMEASGKFTDIDQSLHEVPAQMVDVDRAKCMALGVDAAQVSEAVQFCLGSVEVGGIVQMGQTWQVRAEIDGNSRDLALRLQAVRVRNQQNQLVPLSTVASLREARGPAVIERHNLYPATRVTANIASGIPLAEARRLCDSLAMRELGVSFKLVWLRPDPAR